MIEYESYSSILFTLLHTVILPVFYEAVHLGRKYLLLIFICLLKFVFNNIALFLHFQEINHSLNYMM